MANLANQSQDMWLASNVTPSLMMRKGKLVEYMTIHMQNMIF